MNNEDIASNIDKLISQFIHNFKKQNLIKTKNLSIIIYLNYVIIQTLFQLKVYLNMYILY